MIDILSTILMLSATNHADPYLVAAVVQVESKFNPRAVGGIGELGLMQLRPEYHARPNESLELFKPEINIERGIKYLKAVQAGCKHKADNTFLVCYNAGITGGSRLKHPRLFDYYQKVQKQYSEFKQAKIFAPVEKKVFKQILALQAREQRAAGYSNRLLAAAHEGSTVLAVQGANLMPVQMTAYNDRKRKYRLFSWPEFNRLLEWLS